jgi:hypothetical protein
VAGDSRKRNVISRFVAKIQARPESTYRPTLAVVFGKAEKMQDSDKRKNNAGRSKQIAGLPVVQHKVAGLI